MRSLRWGAGPALLGLALLCPSLRAGPPRPDAVADLAGRIDRHVAAGYAARGSISVPPKATTRPRRSITTCVANWRISSASWLT